MKKSIQNTHNTISNDDFNKAVLIHASVKFKLSSSTVYTYNHYYYKYLHKVDLRGKLLKKVKHLLMKNMKTHLSSLKVAKSKSLFIFSEILQNDE